MSVQSRAWHGCNLNILRRNRCIAKTITTGEGGLIVTNNKKINDFCREFRDHGHQNNSNYPRGQDTRINWGLNLRMSELQAAVGIAQLNMLVFSYWK